MTDGKVVLNPRADWIKFELAGSLSYVRVSGVLPYLFCALNKANKTNGRISITDGLIRIRIRDPRSLE